MSAVFNTPRFPDSEAYLAWEELQTERHEYVSGETYAMSGGSGTHNDITLNTIFFLRQTLRDTPCRVNGCDLKVCVNTEGDFLYPDVVVSCDARDSRAVENRFTSHPWLVAEVLSASTIAYDRGRKFELYRGIETLTHYLLIEQYRPYAELFFKNDQGQWVLQPLQADSVINIERLGQPWPVSTLFEHIDFTPAAQPPTP